MMTDFASEMKFEAAQKIKEKIDVLENYQSHSTILNPKISNVDVFSIVQMKLWHMSTFCRLLMEPSSVPLP